MESTFRLAALGIRLGQDPQKVRVQLQSLFKGNPAAFETAFHRISLNQPVVLGERIPQAQAETLLEKLTAIGLDCRLEPMTLSLVPIEENDTNTCYQCPACGHRQPPAANPPDICERCGIVGQNYQQASELKQALDLERRRMRSLISRQEEQEEGEKARQRQEQLRAMARRHIEREMGITTLDKIKALLAPRILIPVLGSITAAAAGIGLLVWQLQIGQPVADNASPSRTTGVQLTINAPDAVFKVEGATLPAAHPSQGSLAPDPAALAVATPSAGVAAPISPLAGDTDAQAATSSIASRDVGEVHAPPITSSGATAATRKVEDAAPPQGGQTRGGDPNPGAAAVAAATLPAGAAASGSKPAGKAGATSPAVGAASGSPPATSAQAATSSTTSRDLGSVDAPPATDSGTRAATRAATSAGNATATSAAIPGAEPGLLLDVSKLALATPTAGGAGAPGINVRPATRDPHLLASLAWYQLEIGELTAASRSIDRAVELLATEYSSLSSAQLDAFNRLQVDIRAGIASRYYQRQEPVIAQTYWFRATNLANAIATPSERAQTFSSLARTLHEVQASTAKDYFDRAIDTARLIDEPIGRVLALSAIARDLAHTSRLEQSEDWFARAAAAVNAIPNRPGRLIALGALAKHRAEAGNSASAQALLSQIESEIAAGGDVLPPEFDQYRARAFSALALSRVASGGDRVLARSDFAAALHQAQRLTNPAMRADTLLYLARDIAIAGDRDAAAKLVAVAGTWD